MGKVVNNGTVTKKNGRRSWPEMSERIIKKPTMYV